MVTGAGFVIRIPAAMYEEMAAHIAAGYPDEACGLLLVREAATLAGRLEGAGVRVEGVLSPGMFPRAIKDHYDPYGRTHRARLQAHDPYRDGADPAVLHFR